VNAVTFNEKIIQMCMGRKAADEKIEGVFPKWKTSPLFLYSEPSNEAETTAIVTARMCPNNHDILDHTPFPVFRLDITVGEHEKPQYGKYKAKAVVGNFADGLGVFARIDELLETDFTLNHQELMDKAMPIWLFIHKALMAERTRPGFVDFTCDPELMFGLSGRWLTEEEIERRNLWKACNTYICGLMKSVAAFLVSANSPNNHIVSVHPAQEGRSVEWVKARTHYTLISHGHPANDAKVTSGTRVAVDRNAELTRMAHNRRAHQRILRSPRFRYARGKTIWVKATWVGPKEWRDQGGRQIYRILEPVAEEVAA